MGQVDPRVDALVAYDNLRFPADGGDGDTRPDGMPECPSTPATRDTVPPNTKPALGISNDYGLTPTPYTSEPGVQDKNAAFLSFSSPTPDTDTMQVNIRGGTHYESSLIPGNTIPVLGTGTWRGEDMVAWYTLGWFDKYLKADPAADARLLSDRWCDDDLTQGVDQNNDGNMFSFYFHSRYDFTPAGGGADLTSANMRDGCPAHARPIPNMTSSRPRTPRTRGARPDPTPTATASPTFRTRARRWRRQRAERSPACRPRFLAPAPSATRRSDRTAPRRCATGLRPPPRDPATRPPRRHSPRPTDPRAAAAATGCTGRAGADCVLGGPGATGSTPATANGTS